MEEVPPAAAALLDLLSPGGWGRVVKEGYTKHRVEGVGGKKKQNNNPDPSAACKARQTFRKCEYFGCSAFWGGLGEQESVSFPGAAGGGEGTTGRSREGWRGAAAPLSLVAD